VSAADEQKAQAQADASAAVSAPVPVLSVVRGAPDDAELAALLAVVAVLGGDGEGGDDGIGGVGGVGGADSGRAAGSGWTDRSRSVRRPVPHFPGGWRASTLPR
jgi:hypothetical protein